MKNSNYELIPLIKKSDIEKKIDKLANEINNYFINQEIVIIGVLNGSLFFYG